MNGQIDVIYGAQMGDEGKGRYAYQLAGEGYPIVARYNGGANAGHTFVYNDQEVNTHQVPSGIAYKGVMNLITNCSFLDPLALNPEIEELSGLGINVDSTNFGISESASIVTPHHIMLDYMREMGSRGQGTTKKGIPFVAGDKSTRNGVFFLQLETDPDRVEETVTQGILSVNRMLEDIDSAEALALRRNPKESYQNWLKATRDLLPFMMDTVSLIHDTMDKGDKILAEGAQSIGLDIDHGVRPENTSSMTGVAGAQQSLGVSPRVIGKVTGVAKMIKSRVGGTNASFPTKIPDEESAEKLRGTPGEKDYEAGKSTLRKRDVGWFDISDVRTAKKLNGMDELFLTKLDCVPLAGETTKIATHYVDPEGATVQERPNHIDLMRDLTPVYIELPTWKENIRGVTHFEDLPKNAQRLIETIEELAKTPVTIIGTGPDAHEKIDRR